MNKVQTGAVNNLLDNLSTFVRKCIFSVLSVGPIPNHIAFIMDGNRRFSKKNKMAEGDGHSAGYWALISMLRYCYELGVKYVTVYAFSIDNFRRRPEEVDTLMEMMQEKIEGLIKEESMVNRLGIRVYFIGNLKMLSDPLRDAAYRAMAATASNSRAILCVCVAYTSTNEIMNAVETSCDEKSERSRIGESETGEDDNDFGSCGVEKSRSNDERRIKLADIEKNMYMAVAPDPEILIRTSGENRLSNFLLWQSACSYMYAPSVLWPEIGFRHLVWAVLNFQRNYYYLEKKKKQL